MLFKSTPAEFQSAFDLAESVARLQAATKRAQFLPLAEQAAVGKVAQDRVRLQRVIPMVRNSFQPIFVGRFERRDGGIVLAGKFTMSPVVQVIMTFWFGMVGLFALTALLGDMNAPGPHAVFFRFQPLLMIGLGVAIVAAGKWFARNDAAWLSGVIAAALGAAAGHPANGGADASGSGPPLVLKGAAGFLAVSGLLSLAVGVFTPTFTLLPPAWSEVFGLGSIVLSFGVWKRRRWAWWGGFVVLGVSLFAAWFAVPGSLEPAGSLTLRAVFFAFGLLINVVWGRWWYAQRRYFAAH
jgi:hypothetical protein